MERPLLQAGQAWDHRAGACHFTTRKGKLAQVGGKSKQVWGAWKSINVTCNQIVKRNGWEKEKRVGGQKGWLIQFSFELDHQNCGQSSDLYSEHPCKVWGYSVFQEAYLHGDHSAEAIDLDHQRGVARNFYWSDTHQKQGQTNLKNAEPQQLWVLLQPQG